jgi:hypothetical protein
MAAAYVRLRHGSCEKRIDMMSKMHIGQVWKIEVCFQYEYGEQGGQNQARAEQGTSNRKENLPTKEGSLPQNVR